MLKREAEPDEMVVDELFRQTAHRFICRNCRQVGLVVENLDEGTDWGEAVACEVCDRPIPRERLEVFPDAHTCATCQEKAERGEDVERDYCPRCGSLMTVRQPTTTGITRYQSYCPSCRR